MKGAYSGDFLNIKFSCVIVAILVSMYSSRAQNQILADSLEEIYLQQRFDEKDQLKILKSLAEEQSNTDKKLSFSIELINKASAVDSPEYVLSGYLQKGNALRLKSDLSEALESYFEAARIATTEGMQRDLGVVNLTIADAFSIMGNHKRAINYYHEAIGMLREAGDSINIASAYLNAGDEFFNHGELDSALAYFKVSGEIFDALNYEVGAAYNLGNIGLVYAQQGEHQKAEENITAASTILQARGDYYPICVYLTFMSDIYLEKGEEEMALNFADESLRLAKKYGLKEQISDANLKLSELYEASGQIPRAFEHYRNYVVYKDSVSNITSVQEMASMRADFEVAQKQLEVDLLTEQQRNQRLIVIGISIVLALIILLAVGLYRNNRFIRRTNKIIEKERDRSDRLLLNILPEETAQELKVSGKVKAKRFESVTVLFTDFKGFTNIAEGLSPEELVETVDYYFSAFDKIMEKHGMEKIKTIGDAYMAAGGLPFPTDDHAYKMVLAAREMADFVREVKEDRSIEEGVFDVRIGIHTGPVVAGIVGVNKFAYDIWGDTVNIAARMESSSEPGKINISEYTYELIADKFDCTYRGRVNVKNRGALNMYFVNCPKDEVVEAGIA